MDTYSSLEFARIGAQIGRAVLEQGTVLQHRELGLRGRARGRAQHGDLVALALRHDLGEALGGQGLAGLDQLRATEQPGIVVFPHAALVVEHDPAQLRQLVRDLEQLVDLLLVLGEHQLGLGVVEQVGDLLAQRILVDAERHGARAVRSQLRPQPMGPIAADDRHHVAALDAPHQQAQGQCPDLGTGVRPAIVVPDAVLLLPQRYLGAPMGRVVQQQLRRGVLSGKIGQLHRHGQRRSRRGRVLSTLAIFAWLPRACATSDHALSAQTFG